MSIFEQLKSKTVCKNLLIDDSENKYCKFLSNKIGRPQVVSPPFCNIKCFNNGPYDGKELSADQERKFVIDSFNRTNPMFMIDKKFIKKVITKYNMGVDIIIPENYEDIKNSLEFLTNVKGYQKFFLTGSGITSNATRPLKDIDIVLWFDTMEDYLLTDIKNQLPKEISGIKTDFFFGSGDIEDIHSMFFCHLSVDDKKIYGSRWFQLKLKSLPKGFIHIEPKYEGYDAELSNLYNQMLEPSKSMKCCGRT